VVGALLAFFMNSRRSPRDDHASTATELDGARGTAHRGSAASTDGGKSDDLPSVVEKRRATLTQQAVRRAGVTAGEDDLSGYKKQTHDKPQSTAELLADAFANVAVFAELDELTIGELVEQMFCVTAEPGEVLIRQRDQGEVLYILERGECVATLEQAGDAAVATFKPGSLFGELSLLYASPRAATVTCTAKATLWAIDRRAFRATVAMDGVGRADDFLRAVPLLSQLSDEQRACLASAMTTVTYSPGEPIVLKGEAADALYFIRAGEVSVHTLDMAVDESASGPSTPTTPGTPTSRTPKSSRSPSFQLQRSNSRTPSIGAGAPGELSRLRPGDYFGESCIAVTSAGGGDGGAAHTVRSATAVAVARVIALKLLATDFHRLVPNLTQTVEDNFKLRVLNNMPLFAPLGPAGRRTLASQMQAQTYSMGVEVISLGHKGEAFFIIRAGEVEATSEEGKLLAVLGPGDYFGERSLLTDEPTSATVRAVSDETVCYKVSAVDFVAQLGSLQAVTDAFKAEIARRDAASAAAANVDISSLEHMRTLGVGSFGRVKLVRDPSTGAAYALKILSKRGAVKQQQVAHVLQEKALLEQCRHPFVVQLVATAQDDTSLFMLLELCLGGELFTRLHASGSERLPEPAVRFYGACVTAVISYLHERRIAYRDLKPENLLLDDKGYLKLVDFGFAKVVVDRTLTLCGTPDYLAPEVLLNKGHGLPVDWWTVGVLLYEMAAGFTPFHGDHPLALYQEILRAKVRYPSRMPAELRALIGKLLEPSPVRRLGTGPEGGQAIKDDPWFKGLDWAALERRELAAPFVPTIKNPFDDSNYDKYEEDDSAEADLADVIVPPGAFESF